MAKGIWVNDTKIKKVWVNQQKIRKVWVGTTLVWSSEPEWGAWSNWTTTPIAAHENRQVETREQHQYQVYGNFKQKAHKQFQRCALPNRAQICPHACRYVPAGSFDNWWEDHGGGKYYCYGWYWKTIQEWGYNGVIGATSDWVDGAGANSGTYRVTARQTLYRYRDNLNQ